MKPGKRGKRGSIAGGAIKTPAKEKTLDDYGIDKSLGKEVRKMEGFHDTQLEAAVAKAARLAVASVEDGKAVIAAARAERGRRQARRA